MKKRLHKTLSTSIFYSPMSPPSLLHTHLKMIWQCEALRHDLGFVQVETIRIYTLKQTKHKQTKHALFRIQLKNEYSNILSKLST